MTTCLEVGVTLYAETPYGNYLAEFIDHRTYGSRDIIYLVCHVTLREDYMIKGSYDFIEGSSLLYVTSFQVDWP